MKFNISRHILSLAVAISAVIGLQSCSDDNEELIWGNIGSELTLEYGTPMKIMDLPEESDEIQVLPGDIVNIGFISEKGCVNFNNGELIPIKIGTDVIKFYQGKRDNIIKTINVTVKANYFVSLEVGQSKTLSEVFGTGVTSGTSYDDKIVGVFDTGIVALKEGTACVKGGDRVAEFTVTPYTGPNLFNKPYMRDLAQADEIKAGMSAYNLQSETEETLGGLKYTVLTYAPFDNCESIKYYIREGSWSYFAFALVNTGQSPEKALGWLLTNYEAQTSWRDGIYAFTQPGAGYTAWKIYPYDGWGIIQLVFP